MHVHIQNCPRDNFLPLTPELVSKATRARNLTFTVSDSDAGFAAAVPTMEVLVSTTDQVRLRFPCPAPRLRAVFLKHAGVDALLCNNPLPSDVMLLNNSGAHASKAGEYVLMATLMLRNAMHSYAAQQRDRIWKPHFTGTLAGTRATILGVGGLGAAAARALRPHGVHLTGVRNSHEPHPEFDRTRHVSQFDIVLEETDILVLAAPLTPATRSIVGIRQFEILPRHAGIINIARGELIDEPSLIEALGKGQISGAVLDVATTEPPRSDDPLWSAPNLIVTPHVSATDRTTFAAETLRILLANLDDIANGLTPRNLVDLERGY